MPDLPAIQPTEAEVQAGLAAAFPAFVRRSTVQRILAAALAVSPLRERVQKLTEENERLEWLLSQWETWAHRGRPVLCRCGTWTLDGRDGNETVHECAPSSKGEQ